MKVRLQVGDVNGLVGHVATGLLLGCWQVGSLVVADDMQHMFPPDQRWKLLMQSAAMEVAETAALAVSLATAARRRGYSAGWGGLASLSLAGVVVVHLLPDRTRQPAAGFEVVRDPPEDD